MVDIDNDGDLDIYVCNYDAPNELWINDGGGRFQEQAARWRLDCVDASLTPAFCDYDRDGDLDLYLLTYKYYRSGGRPQQPPVGMRGGRPFVLPEFERYYTLKLRSARDGQEAYVIDDCGRPDYLFRNDGSVFTDVTARSGVIGTGFGLSATWWDYDADGWPDLYVCNDFDDPDRLYHNERDGSFTNRLVESVPHTTWSSMGADAADLNNDGRIDFMAVDMSATNHFKQKTTMGAMDAKKMAAVAGPPPQLMRNMLLLNSGTYRFWEAAYLAGLANSDWSWAVKLKDLDCDGRNDVFITNGTVRSFNDSDIPFNQKMLVGNTEWDIYRDTPSRPERNLAYRNEGEMLFRDAGQEWGLDLTGISYATSLSDIDSDGDLDAIVVNIDQPVSIYRNNARSHRLTIALRGRSSNRYGLGSTLRLVTDQGTQVRFLNPITGFNSCDQPIVHFGLGDAKSADLLEVRWPSGRRSELRNIVADQHLVIEEPDGPAAGSPQVARPSSAADGVDPSPPPLYRPHEPAIVAVHQERPFDDFALQPLLPNRLSQLGPAMAVGDVDGDGDDDLVLGGAAGFPTLLLLHAQDGEFQTVSVVDSARDAQCEDMGLLLLDADQDGDRDLYVVSGGVEAIDQPDLWQDRLYMNDGKGHFTRAADGTLPEITSSGGPVTASDFDADGDLDLFVGGRLVAGQYPTSPRSYLLRNDQGRFRDVTSSLAPALARCGMVTGAVWADVNDDRRGDLIVTTEWGPVRLFVNRQGGFVEQTEEALLARWTGWWNGVAARDLDGDQDIDLVVTNFGLNTKYHASPDRPALLYFGDFEGSGRKRLVEAEFEGESLFPVRGKSCSTRAIPKLKERFRTFRDFALADLQQLYTSDRLQQAEKFAATTLESSVFLNDGQGRFHRQPLPRMAQISPAFGLSVTEVDGDGSPDLYLVHNFFSPQPETGRMDGGLSQLLLGNGDGTFRPVDPDHSGLIVPGDARSLVRVDLNGDGRQDWVIGINDDRPVAFARRSAAQQSPISVRLIGRPGNLSAVGSRVTVVRNDGSTQTAEQVAGDGYLSQSSGTLVFGGPATDVQEIRVRWPDGRTTIHRADGANDYSIGWPKVD